jgi:hypothetical protein
MTKLIIKVKFLRRYSGEFPNYKLRNYGFHLKGLILLKLELFDINLLSFKDNSKLD